MLFQSSGSTYGAAWQVHDPKWLVLTIIGPSHMSSYSIWPDGLELTDLCTSFYFILWEQSCCEKHFCWSLQGQDCLNIQMILTQLPRPVWAYLKTGGGICSPPTYFGLGKGSNSFWKWLVWELFTIFKRIRAVWMTRTVPKNDWLL